MFSHMAVGSNDTERSKRFYDALFAAMGAAPGRQDPKGRVAYAHDGCAFIVGPPLDGELATRGNGSTIGFKLASPQAVDAWHAAGVAAGGTSIEDPPGPRSMAFGNLYLAYLRDPDGNKLCAVHRMDG